eukprot:TRINITY_DN10935_c0_g2_i1.p1 TRINITY_DN10935_c0_g2~~TRINITY_DN10935_c0_g2_i1.p1  ORF type:complete len:391 (+),score=50.67 TRINITY_DN10935_c0_g2_i1:144-1316(+)
MKDWIEERNHGLQCRCLGLAVAPLGLMAIISGLVTLAVTERHGVVVWEKSKAAKEAIVLNTDNHLKREDNGKLVGAWGVPVLSKGTPLPGMPNITTAAYHVVHEEYDPDKKSWIEKETNTQTFSISIGTQGHTTWILDCSDFELQSCPLWQDQYLSQHVYDISPTTRSVYTYLPKPANVAFLALQSSNDRLLPWSNPVDSSTLIVFIPDPVGSARFDQFVKAHASIGLMYPLRAFGWFVVWMGVHLVLSWLVQLSRTVPFVNEHFSWLTRLSTVMMFVHGNAAASVVSILTIGITWATVQPSLGIPLALCLVVFIGVMYRTCAQKDVYTQAPVDEDFDIEECLTECLSTDVESVCIDENTGLRPPSPPLRRPDDAEAPAVLGDFSMSSLE